MKNSLHRNKITAVLMGTMILISSLLAMQNSVQAAPVTNGPLVIWGSGLSLLNADGTSVLSPSYLQGHPQYSHDGTKMAWVSQGNNTSKIQIANADGTSVKTLLDSQTQFFKIQFTSTNQIILLKYNDPILYSIDSVTENQTLSASNKILTALDSILDISVSKTDKLAYVRINGCPSPTSGPGVNGVFIHDLGAAGSGTLVSGSCEYTGSAKKGSRSVQWNAAETAIFLGFSDMTNTSSIGQSIQSLNPNGGVTPLVTIGTDASESNMVNQPTTIAMSPDGTKLAIITGKPDEYSFKLWTANVDGTGLTASTFATQQRSLSWARPLTLDAVVPRVVPGPTSTTTTIAATTTTTVAATTTTTLPLSVYDTALPGVTVTDAKVYQTAPSKVAGESAIIVLTATQNKVADIVSKTPSVCLPNDNDLVFIDEGRCIADIVNTKTRQVLRTLKTTVVADDISEIKVGNEIAILTPLYFSAGSAALKVESLKVLTKLKIRISASGSVLLAGHSGNLLGNTPENIKLAKARADATVAILKSRGAKGPFAVASVGALDPVTKVKTQAAQDKNRRVVIVLIP